MEPDLEHLLNPTWSRWMRRLLFPCFVVVFFGLTPVVWSLATGYTFNWRALKFETTAVLFLDTDPPGATVEVNGRAIEKLTPASLERVVPGHYDVRVTAPGHYPWRRAITLRGGEARQFSHILLLPKEPHLTQLFDEAIADFWMEPDGTLVVRLPEGPLTERVRVYGAEAFLRNPLPPILQGTNHDKLSPDGSALLRWDPSRAWLIGFETEPWKNWGMAVSETTLYIGSDNILNAFWHKDSRTVLIVTMTSILIVGIEDGQVRAPVLLKPLLHPLPLSYYDANRGWLFFAQSRSAWPTNEFVVERLELFPKIPHVAD